MITSRSALPISPWNKVVVIYQQGKKHLRKMTQIHKLAVFDPVYDGNFNLAQRNVDVVKASNCFTLTEYPGQLEFYSEYIGKYDEWYALLKRDIKRPVSFQLLDTIRAALERLRSERRLAFGHFIVAYANLFLYKDRYVLNDSGVDRSIALIGIDRLSNDTTVDKVIDHMIDYTEQHPGYIPFISKSGAFGLNTFFFLFFNGLLPIATTYTPYPVHSDYYGESSFGVMRHDFNHINQLREFQREPEYIDSLRNLYLQIINSGLPDQQIKAMILVLFIQFKSTTHGINHQVVDSETNHRSR
jgi:hypothetical protein